MSEIDNALISVLQEKFNQIAAKPLPAGQEMEVQIRALVQLADCIHRLQRPGKNPSGFDGEKMNFIDFKK